LQITAFFVKLIAIVTMIIDHFGAVFAMPIYFRVIGRIAFPLFVFLIAEGCKYTKSMEKYILRLGIFALVSEVPFDLAFRGGISGIDFLNNTNIFYTLWLGVVCVYVLQKVKKFAQDKQYANRAYMLLWLIVPIFVYGAMLAADWLGTDYGGVGVLFVFLTAAVAQFEELEVAKAMQMLIIAIFVFILYFNSFILDIPIEYWINITAVQFLLAGLSTLIIIALYKGKQGYAVKWLFYVVYPVHLLAFALTRGI